MVLMEAWSAVIPFEASDVAQRSAMSGFEGLYVRATLPRAVSGNDLISAGANG